MSPPKKKSATNLKQAVQEERNDSDGFGKLSVRADHADATHKLIIAALLLLATVFVTGYLALQAEITSRVDYLNQRIDTLRIEFSPHHK